MVIYFLALIFLGGLGLLVVYTVQQILDFEYPDIPDEDIAVIYGPMEQEQ